MSWSWPLFEGPKVWPDAPGRFGAVRRHDVHTGIDLYTYSGMPVLAVEAGVVVAIEDFTGPKAGTPWWNDTQAILVEGDSGVVCYGELSPLKPIAVGRVVAAEECLGCVIPVLKKDKGRPRSMLHFELYAPGTTETAVWSLEEERPSNLWDPTGSLLEAWEADGEKRLRYVYDGSLS
jgi:hypothetical protein